jgi:hypothetical protein
LILSDISADLYSWRCPDIGTIFQVCTPKNNVCGSIGVKGRPIYLGIDKLRNRLLALVPDQRAIKIIDLVTNKVTNSLRIPLIIEPSYMILREDGEHAFV